MLQRLVDVRLLPDVHIDGQVFEGDERNVEQFGARLGIGQPHGNYANIL